MSEQPKYAFTSIADSPIAISVGNQTSTTSVVDGFPPSAQAQLEKLQQLDKTTRYGRIIKPEKPAKIERVEATREFHSYIGSLMKAKMIDQDEFLQKLKHGLKYCKTTVTTHLLYVSDVRGMNRPDIFELAIPLLIQCKPGRTFFQTLVRGLVRQDSWRLICAFIRDDVGSKTKQFVFETLECHIRRYNRKCLRAMPRQGRIANRIRGYLKMRPAKWRHILAGGSRGSIVSFMSCNDWKKIDYRLLNIYTLTANYRAFMRHDHDRFSDYLVQHPEIDAAIKKTRYNHFKFYPSQKEIYDTYVVPMKQEDKSCKK